MTNPKDDFDFFPEEEDPITEAEADEFTRFLMDTTKPAPVEPSAESRQLSSAMATGARATFEMYSAYIDEGFSASESLQICIAIITASLK